MFGGAPISQNMLKGTIYVVREYMYPLFLQIKGKPKYVEIPYAIFISDECKKKAAILRQSRLGCCNPRIITFNHNIIKRMRDIVEKLDSISKEREDFHLQEMIIERQTTIRETGVHLKFVLITKKNFVYINFLANIKFMGAFGVSASFKDFP